jgi:hypothetical protein
MFVINWTHKTVTNIGIHCKFKRLFGSKNLYNTAAKIFKKTHKATKVWMFIFNAVRLMEAKRSLNDANKISLYEV